MNDDILEFLNMDWKDNDCYSVAIGHVLAGCILVEQRQVLLVNGCEIYNRKPRKPNVDAHHERLGSKFMQTSMPNKGNKYKRRNVIVKLEDNSRKLIIGSLVFNAIIISSLRLDNNTKPEVGASNYSFTATPSTRIYVSRKNIEKANTSLKKKLVYFNQHDYDSQLRQLRSYLTCPNTYVNARVFSKWTDNKLCRPFSIFTFAGKSGGFKILILL